MHPQFLVVLFLALWVLTSFLSPATAASQLPNEAARAKEIVAARVERPPRLDGTLDDPLWKRTQPIFDFKQREPLEGTEPTERTEVYVLFDSRHVYFGIACFDSDPRRIVAMQFRRDLEMYLDDSFQVLIDPTYSRRNGYVFEVNALGTQRDGLITEEQRPFTEGRPIDFDSSWDSLWVSAARISDRGWSATIQIPFSTLNFKAGTDVRWGVNFRRFIRRKNEENLWSAYSRVYGIWKISEAGELKGLKDIESGRLLTLKPYALGGFRSLSGEKTKALHTGGLDIKYGLRANLVAHLTLNTDFADTDVDQQQFNITPYPILFPEKRRFFLENSDVFQFQTWYQDTLFFSRQVGIDPDTGQEVPVDGGAKLAGKLGGFELGLMDVKTRAQGPNPYANYSVLRVKRPLLDNSYVGIMVVDKESGSAEEPFNRAGGVDGKLVLFKNLTLSGYYAKTRSPGLQGKDYTAGGTLQFRSKGMTLIADHATVQPNFNPAVGFVMITDHNPTYLYLNLTPRPKVRGVRELNIEGILFHSPNTQGVLQSQQWVVNFRALFNNGAVAESTLLDSTVQRLDEPFNIYKNVDIPVGVYRFTRHLVSVRSAEDRLFTFGVGERWGRFYTGRLNELTFQSQYRPDPRFAVSLLNRWNRFRLLQGNFDVNLAGAQFSYAFSRFLSASTFAQVNTAEHQAASVNFRIRYTYRPDSDLIVVYNLGTRFASLAAENPEQLREQRFAVKLTYSFSL